uniref:malate dehydrogenase n=1 Tax=Sargassum horneri TaxID=74089 RepID=A0A097IUP0_9PHAE|nr:malate dehydrogenase [Sargassum horneri]
MAPLRVVITGGAGQIAYSLIPLIARGLVFGPDVKVHLRLLDIPPAANALAGVAMEVQDSLFSTALEGVLATTNEIEAFTGAQVAILLGGFPRRPGMERWDLIGKNAGIMKRMGELLETYASPNCKVVVVANPAQTNCYILSIYAPSLPRKNITSLSRLDHDRMVGMLLHEANSRLISASAVDGSECVRKLTAADIRGACIWGNHSNSQVPDVSAVEFFVDGRWVPIVSVIPDATWLGLSNSLPGGGSVGGGTEGSLVEAVRKRGAAVLGARKLSSAMSAANAIAEHLSDWLSSEKSGHSPAVSMGVTTDGNPFGVSEGIFSSLPVRCTIGGDWNYDEGFSLTDDVRRHLEASVAELEDEKETALKMLEKAEVAAGSVAGLVPRPSL